MKIYQFVPFYNENLVAKINLLESSKWIDQFHVTETNFTFQGKEKSYNFNQFEFSNLVYHKLDVSNDFLFDRKIIPHFFPKNNPKWHANIFFKTSWYNEGIQRNLSCMKDLVSDEDIVILSDVDEIIDSRFAQRIIDEVKKRDVVTIKLHFSLFYLNLYSTNWGGPENYSYRVFIVKGKVLKKWNFDYDTIRKSGERNLFSNQIYCISEVCGFHHSWLGDKTAISNKLISYAHTEHNLLNDIDYIQKCITNKISIFPGHELAADDSIMLLDSIKDNKEMFNDYII
jgi:hypothetical protein